MPFTYVSTQEAISAGGLRMVVVGQTPSPWGEAAKGLFHLKGLDWKAVRLVYDDPALLAWTKEASAPVAIYENEAPRAGWRDILHLAERLAPQVPLLPADPKPADVVMRLIADLMNRGGLCWSRRAQLVQAGLAGTGGFHPKVAAYLAAKYADAPDETEQVDAKVAALLGAFTQRLADQAAVQSPYLIGDCVTAADVYCAAAMALFSPLPDEVCHMRDATRAAFEHRDAATAEALSPALLAHRDHMYAAHLELPLSL